MRLLLEIAASQPAESHSGGGSDGIWILAGCMVCVTFVAALAALCGSKEVRDAPCQDQPTVMQHGNGQSNLHMPKDSAPSGEGPSGGSVQTCTSSGKGRVPSMPVLVAETSVRTNEETTTTTSEAVLSEWCIRAQGSDVQHMAAMLHQICDEMEGVISPTHILHKATIREGINAAVAEATSCGVTSTVLFFPDSRRYARQLKSYDKRWLADFMPNKIFHSNGTQYTHKGRTVLLPHHIMVDRCTTVQEALSSMTNEKGTVTEVFMICIQLYHQIFAFHRRDKVMRDICVGNVVSTLTGTQRRWTLLEYCATAGVGAESNSVPVRMTPPELAVRAMAEKPLKIDCTFDIWQLGILVYEALTTNEYWQNFKTHAAILHTLATDSCCLPHQANPCGAQNVQDMLGLLLHRNPSERPSAEELKRVLEEHDNSGTVGVFTDPYAKGAAGD